MKWEKNLWNYILLRKLNKISKKILSIKFWWNSMVIHAYLFLTSMNYVSYHIQNINREIPDFFKISQDTTSCQNNEPEGIEPKLESHCLDAHNIAHLSRSLAVTLMFPHMHASILWSSWYYSYWIKCIFISYLNVNNSHYTFHC